MRKQQQTIIYEITFYMASGKAITTVSRSVRGVLNNGVVKKIAKEEGAIKYNYWVSRKVD